MRKIKLLIFFMALLFVSLPVQAKEIIQSCRYSDENESNIVYVYIFDDNSSMAYVKKYNGNLENGNSGFGNSEDAQGWDDLNTSSCPAYASLHSSFGYQVHVANDRQQLNSGTVLTLDTTSPLAVCSYNLALTDGTSREVRIEIQKDDFLSYSHLPYGLGGDSFGPLGGILYSLNGYYSYMYSNGTLTPDCPELYFCEEISSYELKYDSVICSNGESAVRVEGEFENVSNSQEKEDQSKNICTRYSTDRVNNQLIIDFYYDVNGERMFSVRENNETDRGASSYYDGVVTVNNILFSVDPNLYDTYWNENTCETTPIYFQFYNGSSSHYVITSEEPETWENGSPDNSTGFEDDQNSGIRDDEGGKFDPDKLCENGNCDISLDNFCGEPTVARTLKFVGLLLFIAKILVPAIIIIMGFVNLFKIITSGKEDDAKKYAKTIVRNIVIGVVIFLAPTIIQMVFDAADDIISPDERSDFANCVNCILDPNDESACIIRESD